MINTEFLRPAKAEAIKKRHIEFDEKRDLTSKTFQNAVVLPLKNIPDKPIQFGHGGVISDEKYIEMSGIPGRVGGYYEWDTAEKCDEKVVYCGAFINQWGHFLIESAARLWYYLKNDRTVDKYVFIAEENKDISITGNYRRFLELLGVFDKIEIIIKPTQFREIIVPELGYSRTNYYTKEYKEIFETVVDNAVGETAIKDQQDKVFLTRSSFSKAKITDIGHEILDSFFANNGFRIISPENMILDDLIRILRESEVCAASSGTLPHNFLFCRDEQKVIIMERQTCVNEIQTNIDIIKALNVDYVDASYTIYPTSAGFGPFFFAYTKPFEQFVLNNKMLKPDSKYLALKFKIKCLKHYMKVYKMAYGRQWGFEEWQIQYMDAYYEAYREALEDLGPWLSGERPISFSDMFDWNFVKQTIKRIVKKQK